MAEHQHAPVLGAGDPHTSATPRFRLPGHRNLLLDELTSALAAQLSVSVFNITLSRWLDQDGEQPLSELVHDTLQALRAITADPSPINRESAH